mmetsp:Transcript_62603/g.141229  ORF Transcript_62603/g.141229 Transcript_62603/m.141229 type:complete len:216 (+) Transcript_62603:209-856(+)
MVPLAFERLAPMKNAVVVEEHNVANLHHDCLDVPLADIVHVADILRADLAEVAMVDVGHAHLGNSAGTAVAQVAAVVVEVAEPDRLASDWVPVDGRLRVLDGLQAVGVRLVGAVHHLEVHVKFGRDNLQDQVLQVVLYAFLHTAKGLNKVQVEVADGDANLALVEALQDVLVHVVDDLGSVRNDELAATLGRGLEADKCAKHGRLYEGRLVVESD